MSLEQTHPDVLLWLKHNSKRSFRIFILCQAQVSILIEDKIENIRWETFIIEEPGAERYQFLCD